MAQETPVEVVNQPKGCLARLRRIVLIVAIVYVMAGLVTALSFSFFAGGGLGPRGFLVPGFYAICMFWPLAIWIFLARLLSL